ncbi:MAG: DUF4065 domain-containing protein [Pseudomonadota bacterium]|nr:DUF4065 domain-containing protein [Pseudomonadota bacterium]
MSDVFLVADDILKLSKKAGKALTPLQLMKLTYIAHGFGLALLNRDLIPERIEAWQYGPVIPDLYHVTKKFGRKPIPLSSISDDDPKSSPEALDLIEQVVDKYGSLSGYALSQLTHKAGSPWHQVFEPDTFGIEIPDELIREHYKAIVDAAKT